VVPVSHGGRGPPGHEHGGKAQHNQRKRNRAPPVLAEGCKAMGALTPSPEDAKQQEDGADDLANPPHGLRVLTADATVRVAADTVVGPLRDVERRVGLKARRYRDVYVAFRFQRVA
jgi:hypothetical protein